MNKDLIPKNHKGQRHGYWEVYWSNGELWRKCVFINGKLNGVFESYSYDGKLRYKNYHL